MTSGARIQAVEWRVVLKHSAADGSAFSELVHVTYFDTEIDAAIVVGRVADLHRIDLKSCHSIEAHKTGSFKTIGPAA